MKKLFVLLFVLCSMSAFAQDVIVKKDGSTIVCRVEKVSETDVTYKLWSDLKGSSYVMDKSLVSAINYENGKKETFSEIVPQPSNPDEGKQSMSDADLEKLWEETNAERLRVFHASQQWQLQQQEALRLPKKVKRLKTWGWIGGGLLAAGGIGVLAYGCSGDFYGFDGCIAAGTGAIIAGAGVTTLCLVKAHKQKKKIDALQTSSIYRYDIPFSNGSSLSISADMLNDRIMNKRTVGLGLSYNF